MPNWCSNQVQISGPANSIKRLVNQVEGKDDDGEVNHFDFNKIVPIPENVFKGDLGEKEKKKYGTNNWYDWCCTHWGTKWNSDNAEVSDDNGTANISFMTAWSPPEPVIEKLADQYPDLHFVFKYAEPGCCFAGCREYKGGHCVNSEDYDSGSEYRRICEELGFELEDVDEDEDEEEGE